MHVQEALVGVKQAALHALARRDAILVCRADELLDIRGDVRSALPGRVRAVEAILAEIVLALLALHHGGLLLALLAHDDAGRLPDDIDLVLLLADLAQELDRVFQVLHERVQVELLLDISLQCLLDDPEKEELRGAVDANDPRQSLDGVGRRWREALRRAPHDLRDDRHELLLGSLEVDADVSPLHFLLVTPGLVVDLPVPVNQRVRLLKHLALHVIIDCLSVFVFELLPVRWHRRPGGFLGDPEQLRFVHHVDADEVGDADHDLGGVVVRGRRILVEVAADGDLPPGDTREAHHRARRSAPGVGRPG
mmetsp:Transcript_44546/g.129519  ORF Transcript_44546/g.129519 Transcript_44546/m.129519 type:complete len:308 (+) Transcript_44546:731-1654(+)